MTERAISYLVLLATTVAVLLVVIIQPQNTAIQKEKIRHAYNPGLANTCTAGDMACNLALACTENRGAWNGAECTYPSTTCNGQSCDAMTCQAIGGYWDETSCYLTNPNGTNGSSGAPAAISGVSANEKLSQQIESECLKHVERSGYGETVKKYGWFNNVRIYAVNACTYAYLATNGKFSSNNDLYLIANLMTNDFAVRQEDIGMLYRALENAPAQQKGQSLTDYLDSEKDGVTKYLKAVMDIMASFNEQTTTPAYLTNPLPYVTITGATEYNAVNKNKIVSLEEKLLALLPKPETSQVVEEVKKVEPIKKADVAIETPTQPAVAHEGQSVRAQAIQRLTQIKNLFRKIRDAVIVHIKISRSPEIIRQEFFRTVKIIERFDTCLKNHVC